MHALLTLFLLAWFQCSDFVLSFYSYLRPARLTLISRGERHGKEHAWYPNGQLSQTREFSHGVLEGVERGWYPNGNPRLQKEYRQGKEVGEQWGWHPGGELADYVRFENGRIVARKSWSPVGRIQHNFVWNDQDTIGMRGGRACKPKKEIRGQASR